MSSLEPTRHRALERNLILLEVIRALRMALFAIPVIVLFWQEAVGVGVFEVFLLQAIFSGATPFLRRLCASMTPG